MKRKQHQQTQGTRGRARISRLHNQPESLTRAISGCLLAGDLSGMKAEVSHSPPPTSLTQDSKAITCLVASHSVSSPPLVPRGTNLRHSGSKYRETARRCPGPQHSR